MSFIKVSVYDIKWEPMETWRVSIPALPIRKLYKLKTIMKQLHSCQNLANVKIRDIQFRLFSKLLWPLQVLKSLSVARSEQTVGQVKRKLIASLKISVP